MRPLNIKLRGNVYEGSLNTIFFAEPSLIMSFSIYESFRKKWRINLARLRATRKRRAHVYEALE